MFPPPFKLIFTKKEVRILFTYTVKRIFSLIPVLIGMTLVVFAIIHAIPGNPAQVILGQRATKAAVEALTQQLGLDRPWYIQYFDYINQLLHGDLVSPCGREVL